MVCFRRGSFVLVLVLLFVSVLALLFVCVLASYLYCAFAFDVLVVSGCWSLMS